MVLVLNMSVQRRSHLMKINGSVLFKITSVNNFHIIKIVIDAKHPVWTSYHHSLQHAYIYVSRHSYVQLFLLNNVHIRVKNMFMQVEFIGF